MAGVIIEELDSDEEYGSPRTGEEEDEHQDRLGEEFGTPRAVVNDREADHSTTTAYQGEHCASPNALPANYVSLQVSKSILLHCRS